MVVGAQAGQIAPTANANAPVDWATLIHAGEALRPAPIQARTYVRSYQSASAPVELICADGNTYVVKPMRENNVQQGQMMFNDQAAARLGRLVGAPIPEVALIEITAELIAQNAATMANVVPGTAHGSRKVENVTERVNSLDHADKGNNRHRFTLLAVFFGWLVGNDRQFIFEKTEPFTVYSHDHGHFFPNGPAWSVASLNGQTAAQPWQEIVNALQCTQDELRAACAPLHGVTVNQIAQAVAIPPTAWAFDVQHRCALAEFVSRRRTELAAAFPLL